MALRLHTLSTGRTGVRPEVVTALAGLLNAGIIPAVHEFGSLGCSGDLSPLAHVAIVLQGEGQVVSPDGTTRPAAQALAAGRAHPGGPGREGGPGPHQRHRRDARDARPGPGRPRRPGPDRRHHDRHERGGPAGHGPRVRRRPGRHAPAPGPGRLGGEPAPAAGRVRRSWPAIATTRPTWSRTRTRCAAHPRWPARRATPWPTPAASPSGSWTRSSTTRSSPSTAAWSPTATSTAPRWPTCWTSWRSPWPTWPRSASGAPTACWTARATRACRRSWPTRSASTPAT